MQPIQLLLVIYQYTLLNEELTGSEIGFVLAVGPLAQIISQPFWGYMSDKHKTVKRFLLICIFGLIIFSSIFLSVTQFYLLIFFGFLFYFFSTPIGALGDSLAQRRADDVGVSFGTIVLGDLSALRHLHLPLG